MAQPVDTVAKLEATRARITDPARWTQGALARGKEGLEVGIGGQTATCWCLLGALWLEGQDAWSAGARLVEEVIDPSYACSLGRFNDSHTHAEVLAVLDAAIVKARAIT